MTHFTYKPLKKISFYSLLFMFCSINSFATSFAGGGQGLVVNDMPHNSTSVRVVGPENITAQTDGTLLQLPENQFFVDGQYSYEIFGYLSDELKPLDSNENGRGESVVRNEPIGAIESGNFRLLNGAVVKESAKE